jgi:hypothetical protein
MKAAVRAFFPVFSAHFEGRVYHMYLDCKGLVTTGVGCLIDTMSAALALPWTRLSDGAPALPSEVVAEWRLIKGHQELAKLHYAYAGKLCKLRLTGDAINKLVDERTLSAERYLSRRLPSWDAWPADAQLATMSMAWAMGAGFVDKFPRWLAAATRAEPDFATMAAECKMRETNNAGVVPRNRADAALFRSAAVTTTPETINLGATGI